MAAYDMRSMEEPYKGSPYPLGGLDSSNGFESRSSGLDVIVEEVVRPEGRKGDAVGQLVLLVSYAPFRLPQHAFIDRLPQTKQAGLGVSEYVYPDRHFARPDLCRYSFLEHG